MRGAGPTNSACSAAVVPFRSGAVEARIEREGELTVEFGDLRRITDPRVHRRGPFPCE